MRAFGFFAAYGMALTIVVLHVGDRFGVDVDQTAWRAQRHQIRIFTESLMAHKQLRMIKLDGLLLIPEHRESR
ncbi:hypothetical protein NGUA02_04603 [Salmonella enterica]|nr:hypothetical protein NGUA02_04603 [Salmonella enterica]